MESIGTQFRAAREVKGSTLSQAASATRIKFQHLEAMERDDFSNMAAAAYARGFIKLYAEYLELPVEPLVQAYSELHAPNPLRQGLSSDDIPPVPRPADAASPEDQPGGARSDGVSGGGLVRRIALPVAAIVLGVLLVTGIARLTGGGCAGSSAGEPGAGRGAGDANTLRVDDPPDVYLDASIAESLP